ncbi:V8-like Glu-specific endopeptidase [Terracoccus luteus]|uniref:V8-like Glu-specific endopeptidase n=2 Tax=Terracoccus luteus TaxID=53356 RepID=A0A495XZR7_9MICO|nr:V8-like Glu-specific endopeptidase [Terracoccus luteus]
MATNGLEHQILSRIGSLQTFTSSVYSPTDARVAARRMLLASDLVCRIDVDGDQQGTGILVAPTLVATAAHLVGTLVDASPTGGSSPLPGSSKRVSVTFGDMADLLEDSDQPTLLKGTPAPLAASWLAFYSPPAVNELSNTFEIDSTDGIGAEGPWDIAILRLAHPRPFRTVKPPRRLPRQPFQVHVLHHPSDGAGKGLPLLWSIGRVDRRLGDPPLRLLHSANTSGGSSGAPVFDSQFRVIGIHQAGGVLPPAVQDAANNRAVPVTPWVSQLAGLELPDAAPVVATVEIAGPQGSPINRTVIGRHVTISRIWRGMKVEAPARDRLLAVLGDPGLGLRFTKHLVHALVTQFGGTYAAIDVANCQGDDVDSFSAKVAGAFAAGLPPRQPSGLTTRQRDTRNQTAPDLAKRLQRIARHTGAWLVLEGFESPSANASPIVIDLVRQLILELPSAPGVRLVLAGWRESLPSGFESSVEYLEEPTADDVSRSLLPPGSPDDLVGQQRPLVQTLLAASKTELPNAGPYEIAEDARAKLARMLAAAMAMHAAEGIGT